MQNPELALWRAVVEMALNDAAGKLRGMDNLGTASSCLLVRRARAWLTGGGKDFRRVCDWAGLDAGAVRERALEVIEASGSVWFTREKANEPAH